MENKEVSTAKKISIIALLIALAGIFINLAFFKTLRVDAVGQYANYIENLERYPGSDMVSYRLGLYRLDKMCEIFAIVSIVTYVILIFLQRVRPLYLILPLCGVASAIFSTTTMKDLHINNLVPLYVGFVGFIIVSFIFTLIGVITRKARFALFAGISFIIAMGGYLIVTREYLLQNVTIANVGGAEAIFFFHLLTLRKRKEKVVSAPTATTPELVNPVNETPVPKPTTNYVAPNIEGTSILSTDVLVIDEKVSLGKKSFKIFNEQGTQIGFVNENISGGANASRVLLGTGTAIFQSSQFLVCEADGTPRLGVSKKGLYGSVIDIEGNTIATLKKSNLLDANGNSLMRFRSTLKEGMFVETLDGQRIANFKKAYFTAKAMFTAADKYTVTFTPGTPVDQRILAIGTVLIWEMITGNK